MLKPKLKKKINGGNLANVFLEKKKKNFCSIKELISPSGKWRFSPKII